MSDHMDIEIEDYGTTENIKSIKIMLQEKLGLLQYENCLALHYLNVYVWKSQPFIRSIREDIEIEEESALTIYMDFGKAERILRKVLIEDILSMVIKLLKDDYTFYFYYGDGDIYYEKN